MSNLIPTSIVDKNGKQTTVHKKQQRTVAARKLPAPAVKKPLKAELVASSADQFAQEYVDSQGPSINRDAAYAMIHRDVLNGLKKCSMETLLKISGPTMNENRRSVLANGLGDGWDEAMVNDFMNVVPIFEDNGYYYKQMKDFLIGLEYVKELDGMNRGKYPEERASQTTALIKVLAHMDKNPHNIQGLDPWEQFHLEDYFEEAPYIKDEKLRKLILSPDYDREAIVDIITERSIFDADQIIAMLEIRESGPLMTGAL